VAIKVNRILSRKRNIAGIPADVFIPAVFLDVVFGIFGCLMFKIPPIPLAIFCLTLNIIWAILVARGVWRFLGTFHHPPRYHRANIRYNPFLQELVDRDSRPIQSKQKKRRSRR
jgi:fatty acid desaturase